MRSIPHNREESAVLCQHCGKRLDHRDPGHRESSHIGALPGGARFPEFEVAHAPLAERSRCWNGLRSIAVRDIQRSDAKGSRYSRPDFPAHRAAYPKSRGHADRSMQIEIAAGVSKEPPEHRKRSTNPGSGRFAALSQAATSTNVLLRIDR